MHFKDQKISKGSSQIVVDEAFSKDQFMIDNMHLNKAYTNFIHDKKISNLDEKRRILDSFKKRYHEYREFWHNVDKKITDKNLYNSLSKPHCIDIETASICDLACPHCHREYIVTPDKIMKEELYIKIIKEIKDLNIPSIKLNWRGEPLLNPLIDKFILLAKTHGVIDVSINTNATTLDEKKGEKIINAGLDQIIFSFDGGTKETYEKMRPGRFQENHFETIYENIKNFCLLKRRMKKIFPITKIQMVMTKSSRNEVKNFHKLFSDIIDYVVVTQYQERGGKMDDLSEDQKIKLSEYKKKSNNKDFKQYIAKANGDLLVSKDRKICDQLYQRLMVTYDGRVGMCCHDWGAKHCLGYFDQDGINNYENDLKKISDQVKANKKGFELLRNTKMPERYNEPDKKISSLSEIWNGNELKKVRDNHECGNIDSVEVCKNCSYKNSYNWEKI
tara:strand:- start:13 stop:1350 length:1338 start_codon:yes stop_codon:yes gene_type:complete